MESRSYEVLPVESHEVQILQVDAVERANVDSQVATAKRYTRDIRRSIDNSVVMATMNQDTARSCSYALRRETYYRAIRTPRQDNRIQLG